MRSFLRNISILFFVAIIIGVSSATLYATTRTSVATGNWNATATWSGGTVPTGTDSVIIAGGFTVTVNVGTAVGGTLTVNTGSTLDVAGFNFSVTGTTSVTGTLKHSSATGTKTFSGNVIVNSGGVWNETANPAISFGGNLQNDGTFTSGTGVHTFTGTTKTFSGTNTITIPSVTINGSYTNNGQLAISTALTGSGSLAQGETTPNSTLDLGGTISSLSMTAYNTHNTITYSGTAQTIYPIIYYHLTLSGSGVKTMTNVLQINNNFTLSGTVTVTMQDNLDVGGDFIIGAGTSFTTGAFPEYYGGSFTNNGTYNSTGSTINFYLNNGGSSIGGSITGTNKFNNVNFNDASKSWTFTGNAEIGGSFTITTGTVTAPGETLTIAGGFSNSGTFTHNNGTVNLNGAGAQAIGGSTASTFNNLTLSGSGAKTVTGSTVNGVLSLQGTATAAGTIPTYGGSAVIEYAGSSSQTTGIEMGATVTAGVKINNASGVTLSGSKTFNGTLTFTAGKLATGANTLTAGTITGASTTSYVNGNLLKAFPTGGPTIRTFEVGDATIYAPVSVTINNVSVGGSLTANTTGSEHPNIATSGLVSTKDVNRYWTLTNTGMTFDNYNTTLNWQATDVDGGANTANFTVTKYNAPNWVRAASSGQTSTSVTATGLTSFSDFAVGELTEFTITSAATNGTITPTPSASVDYGTDQAFTFAPSTGYHFDSLMVDGTKNTDSTASYTFTNVTAGHDIHAYFSIDKFTITSAATNGTITPTPSATVDYGADQAFTFAPTTGYHFDSLIVDGTKNTDSTASYTFINVTAGHDIHAYFSIDKFTITSAATNGTITPTPSTTVDYGADQAFTFAPTTGYHFDSLVVDGTMNTDSTASYTFTNVTAGHDIHAYFSIDKFTITSAATNGTITPTPSTTVDYGADQAFTFAPTTGYHFDSLVVDGTMNTDSTASYTFTNVTAGHDIHAYFSIDKFTITSAATNGTITPTPSTTVDYGADQAFTFAPTTGYHFDSLIVDGTKNTDSTASYTFTNVTAGHDIHAYFSIDKFTITSAATNGTITPTPSTTVDYGADQAFTFAPTTGYHFDSLVVDGTMNTDSTASYTFTNVTAGHDIHAYFSIDKFTITSAATNGTITPTPSTTVDYGADQAFTFAPTTGYHFDSLIVDGTKNTDSTASYTFTNVTAGHDIHAYFSIDKFTITSAATNGTITPTPSATVDYGADQAFTFAPTTGYHFDSLIVDGTKNTDSTASYTFTNVTAGHDIHAYFSIDKFTITSAATNGTITPTPSATVDYGADQAFTFAPTTGYHFDSLIVDGTMNTDSTASYTFTNVTAGHDIHAYFSIDKFTITSAATNGTITPTPSATVDYGADQAFTFAPTTGYHFDSLVVDGTMNTDSTASYTFTNVTAGHDIHAYFSIDKFTITSAATNGTITPTPSATVDYGADQAFTFAPTTGYHFDSLVVDGTKNTDSTASYTFTNVTAGHDIHAYFSIDKFTITSAATNGTITPTPSATVDYGADQAFTFAPTTGYHFDSLVVDGTMNTDSTASYTFINVTAGHDIHAYFSIDKFTITATAGSNGSIDPTGSTVVNYGDDATFKFYPATGYHIDSLYVDGTPNAVDTQYTFNNVQANHTIHVTFAIDKFTITSAATNGTITPTPSATVDYGADQAFTFAPTTGYHFDSLIVDGTMNTDSTASYTFTNVTAGHDIHAYFSIDKFTITSAATNGTITPTPSATVDYGADQAFIFAPTTGYHFDSLVVDGTMNTDSTASYTFINVTAGHDIHAYFSIDKFTITATAGSNGSIDPTGSTVVNYGDDATFKFYPATGYHIDSLYVDGTPNAVDTQYTFNNVQANHTIHVTFAIDKFTITSAATNGTITPTPSATVDYGADQAFTFTPTTGYHFDSLVVDGTMNTDSTASYTFINVTAGHDIHAYFSIDKFTITATAGSNGSIDPTGSTVVNYGDDATFKFYPATGYHIDSLYVDGTPNAVDTQYTFNNVQANHTIHVTFAIDKFTITSAATNGTITPTPSATVDYGADQAFTFAPTTGYHFDSLIVDGTMNTDSTASYTFINVTAGHDIHAYFSIDKFTITATAGSNGSIDPTGSTVVNYGDDATFKFYPATGYHIDSLYVDGTPNAVDTQYTFNNVQANHTIHVTFAIDKFTITSSAGANGSIDPTGSTVVNYGDDATFKFYPATGYHIDSLYVDGTPIVVDTQYTFNNVQANHTIHVTFAVTGYNITATSGAHGSITPSGSVFVMLNSDQTFTITPDTGWSTDSILVDGVSQPITPSYTFTTVTAPHTIRVVFKAEPFNISIVSGDWSNPATWSLGTVPLHTDSVVIGNGKTVNLDINGVCGAISVQGTLNYSSNAGRILSVTTSGSHSAQVNITGTVAFASVSGQRIFVAGNFNCSGTITNNSTGSNGSFVVFNGSGTKTISSSASLRGVQVNNTVLELSLTQSLRVTSGVLLTSGKIVLGNYNLYLEAGGNIDTGSSGSYIVTNGTGKLSQIVTTAGATFPVGTTNGFNRVTLATSTFSDTFSVRILSSISPASAKDSAAVQRTIDFSRAGTDSLGLLTMTFMWNASEQGDLFVPASAASWRHNGTAWVEEGTFTGYSGSGPFIGTITNILTTGSYVLGNGGVLPITLAEFRGITVDAQSVKIEWTTMSEQNTYGFYVQRKGETEIGYSDVSPLINGAGTTVNEQHAYSWTDTKATDEVYYYRLRTVDLNGDVEYSSAIKVNVVLDVKSQEPLVFKLDQNYPNPFNPATTIRYSVPTSGLVSLKIYNLIGQEVASLVNEFKEAGRYSIVWNAMLYPSGSYFYRIVAGENTKVLRLVLIK